MATNVVVSEAMPAGLSFVSATVTKGAYSRTGNSFVWNVGNLSPGSGAILTMTASASAAGSYQTSVTASSVDEDLNPIDNIISFTTTVNEPTEMAFSRQGNSLTISWPASAAGTVVEASESLANPNWQPVNIAPTSFNGRLSITITPGTAQRFFRLSQ
jgi:hypothetical protein